MTPRLKKHIIFFSLCLFSMTGILWHPVQEHFVQKEYLETLNRDLTAKENQYQKRLKAQAFYTTLTQRLDALQKSGFQSPINAKEVKRKLSKAALKNRVTLRQFHFGKPWTDRPNNNVTVTYLPVQIQLTSHFEKNIYHTLQMVNETMPAFILPTRLKVTQMKRNAFLAHYDFHLVRSPSPEEG